MIYIIRPEGGGPVKIGVSENPTDRLKNLQTGNPARLELLCVFPGNSQEENQVHKSLEDFRVHGEWFDLGEKDPQMVVGELLGRSTVPFPVPVESLNSSFEASMVFAVKDFSPPPRESNELIPVYVEGEFDKNAIKLTTQQPVSGVSNPKEQAPGFRKPRKFDDDEHPEWVDDLPPWRNPDPKGDPYLFVWEQHQARIRGHH